MEDQDLVLPKQKRKKLGPRLAGKKLGENACYGSPVGRAREWAVPVRGDCGAGGREGKRALVRSRSRQPPVGR